MKTWSVIVIAAALAGTAGYAAAQQGGSPETGGTPQSAPGGPLDASGVLSRIHATDQLEIQLGQLAKEKGQSEAVRAYGDRLVRDHTSADTRLLRLAKSKNIAVTEPKPASSEEAAQMAKEKELPTRLGSLSGAEFDREFVAAMHAGHEDKVRMLESVHLDDPRAQALVEKVIPILKQHLALAERLEHKTAGNESNGGKHG